MSWRSLLDLVRTNNETENKQKHKRENGGGTTIPESVAETPETEDRPAGEALHLGMPLNDRLGLDNDSRVVLYSTFHWPSYPRWHFGNPPKKSVICFKFQLIHIDHVSDAGKM